MLSLLQDQAPLPALRLISGLSSGLTVVLSSSLSRLTAGL